jgi:membrane protease YdiL (CAAX protease family)
MAGGLSVYAKHTRTNTYGFLAALPLFAAYELFLLWSNPVNGRVVRVGAEVWTKELLWMIGLQGQLALGLIVILAGLVILWRDRHRNIPIRISYFMGLLLESGLYAVVFAVLISSFVGMVFAVIPPLETGQITHLGLSIGAGLYEELFFRVLLVSGLYAVVRVLSNLNRTRSYIIAAVVGALIFSAVHYLGPLGDAFALPSFLFRFLFGLVLNALYVVRGFAVAAWTHALYDIMLVL